MKKDRLIPLYRTFTNWLITVAVGSALLPFVSLVLGGNGVFTGHRGVSDETLMMILLSMLVSAVFSIPALLILFFTHWILNSSTHVWKKHQLVQNCVHLFVALGTFTVLGISFEHHERSLIGALILAYVPTGIIVWNITYWLYKRKKALHKITNNEVLDEL